MAFFIRSQRETQFLAPQWIETNVTQKARRSGAAAHRRRAWLRARARSFARGGTRVRSIALDLSPTRITEARALYPQLAECFLVGNLFQPAAELRGVFDVILEHTCLSGLHPTQRANYRAGIDLTLRAGGLLRGVWYINPSLDPGEEGPPFPLSLSELTALFSDSYEIVADYVPDVAFPGREGRERMRVLRRIA